MTRAFQLDADAPRWAVLEFWGAGEDPQVPALRLQLFDEPVAFG